MLASERGACAGHPVGLNLDARLPRQRGATESGGELVEQFAEFKGEAGTSVGGAGCRCSGVAGGYWWWERGQGVGSWQPEVIVKRG